MCGESDCALAVGWEALGCCGGDVRVVAVSEADGGDRAGGGGR